MTGGNWTIHENIHLVFVVSTLKYIKYSVLLLTSILRDELMEIENDVNSKRCIRERKIQQLISKIVEIRTLENDVNSQICACGDLKMTSIMDVECVDLFLDTKQQILGGDFKVPIF